MFFNIELCSLYFYIILPYNLNYYFIKKNTSLNYLQINFNINHKFSFSQFSKSSKLFFYFSIIISPSHFLGKHIIFIVLSLLDVINIYDSSFQIIFVISS